MTLDMEAIIFIILMKFFSSQKLISNKGYIQILDKYTVWDTVYTDRVFDCVIQIDITEQDTGSNTVWVTRVINRVMQHFHKFSILEFQITTRVETRFRLPMQ